MGSVLGILRAAYPDPLAKILGPQTRYKFKLETNLVLKLQGPWKILISVGRNPGQLDSKFSGLF